MPQRVTTLWIVLLVAGVLILALAWSRMDKHRGDVEVAQHNYVVARRAMDEIRKWRSSSGRAAGSEMETPQLNAQLRQAAIAAGLADAPGSEPGSPTRIGNSEYEEMLVFLRFEPVTLKQLTTFLHELARIDPSSRAKTIELSPPTDQAAAPQPPGAPERWTADVAVAYLTYRPQKPGR